MMDTKFPVLSVQTSHKKQTPQADHIDFRSGATTKEMLFFTLAGAMDLAPASRTLTKRYFLNYIVFFTLCIQVLLLYVKTP